jgi:hypothetical protein
MFENCSALLSYAGYFKVKGNSFYKYHGGSDGEGNISHCSIEYSREVLNFIKEIYSSGFIYKGDYTDWKKKGDTPGEILSVIDSADFNTLKKILTFYIRGERFCDGLMASAIDNGIILRCLERLEKLAAV